MLQCHEQKCTDTCMDTTQRSISVPLTAKQSCHKRRVSHHLLNILLYQSCRDAPGEGCCFILDVHLSAEDCCGPCRHPQQARWNPCPESRCLQGSQPATSRLSGVPVACSCSLSTLMVSQRYAIFLLCNAGRVGMTATRQAWSERTGKGRLRERLPSFNDWKAHSEHKARRQRPGCHA